MSKNVKERCNNEKGIGENHGGMAGSDSLCLSDDRWIPLHKIKSGKADGFREMSA